MDNLSNASLLTGYREILPDGCPPNDAMDTCEMSLLRLVPSASPTEADFDSHAKLGKVLPKGVCGCRWASCSMFKAIRGEHIPVAITKLPKVRNKKLTHIAEIRIDQNSGKFKEADTGNCHVDLWMYAGFDPMSAIKGIREIQP